MDSAREWEIIEHPTSCYVIGRSGTGKTTTMLLKMLGIESTWQQYPEMGPRPRQVFVTQSPVLVEKVEEFFLKLALTFGVDVHSPEEMQTANEEIAQVSEPSESEEELIGQEYKERWRLGLPKTFSELLDSYSRPLFITYDQVWASSSSKALSHYRANSSVQCLRMTSTAIPGQVLPRGMPSGIIQCLPLARLPLGRPSN